MTAIVLRGDARSLVLPDESVDLIVTSPPYWSLRSYTDGGEHYDGQIGSEPTPGAYISALLECTAEWARVLKPTGSIFVVLGDKYSARASPSWRGSSDGYTSRQDKGARVSTTAYAPRKSLLCLPQRYMLACIDELGLGVREDIVAWYKPNAMPESVEDRARREHETIVHLTRQPQYFSAIDEIREPHQMRRQRRPNGHKERQALGVLPARTYSTSQRDELGVDGHPLGRLPGSVWSIPTTPFVPPAWLGIEHFATFPLELPRRCILGWSPAGICTACGEGRRPVSALTGQEGRHPGGGGTYRSMKKPGQVNTNLAEACLKVRGILGYACACTPRSSHRGEADWRDGREVMPEHRADDWHSPGASVPRRPGGFGTRVPLSDGEWEYHFDRWSPAPSRPAVVLDPFGGSGATALVADVLGRTGITVDRSADYCRLARWRTTDPGERAKAMQVPKPPPVPDGQEAFDFGAEAAI